MNFEEVTGSSSQTPKCRLGGSAPVVEGMDCDIRQALPETWLCHFPVV